MIRTVFRLLCCLLLLVMLQQGVVCRAQAGVKEERVQQLQEKLQKLKEQLATMQEAEIHRKQTSEAPWQPLQQSGEEWTGYQQYAYLLAPQLRNEDLNSTLQQLRFLAGLDKAKERGTLFVVPARPLAVGEALESADYNRELASTFLQQLDVPTAIEAALVVTPQPLGKKGVVTGPLLFVDLTGCDRILRARIFELLQKQHLFADDDALHGYLWRLLKNAAPRAFTVSMQGERLNLEAAKD